MTEAPTQDTQPAAETQDYLSLAREAYSTSTTYFDSSIRPQIESALRQFQGVHPNGSKYHSDSYKSRSRLFRPKTRATIRKNEATAAEAFFSTQDVVSVTAQDDSNKEQQASAEVMLYLLDYRLKKSIPWFLTLMGAFQDADTVGACVSYQDWVYDPKKKVDKPIINLLPLENLRIDPGANWMDPINTSPYVIEMIPMYVKDVRARMKKIDPKTKAPKWKTVSDADIAKAAKGVSDSTRLTRERGRTDPKDQSQAIGSFTVVWVHRNIMEIDGQDMVWYTLATERLLTDPVPIEQVWFHGRRPYVMGYSMLEAHKNYPDGIPGNTKDIQAEINEIANQRIDNVKFAMNKRYFFKRGAQVDLRSLMRNVPGSATGMNNVEDVKVLETQDVTGSSYQEQDRLNLDFDDVSGAFSPSSIQANRKLNETVGGMTMLSTNANQVGNYQLRTFVETWVEPVLRQLVLLEQHYETDTVVLGLAGRKADIRQKFNVDTITDELLMNELTLSVNVGVGATNPQEQINNFMSAMKNLREILADGELQKYGMDVQEVIKELFGKLGYRDGARFFNTEEEDPALTAAKATIEQLQQQLSQKVSPEMVAKQMEKIDAEIVNLAAKNKDILASSVEKTLRSFFSSGQTAQMIAAVPQVAPLADELVKAAGYQAPNPAGVDPNFPQPGAPVAGITQNSVKDPRTGVEFTPGAASAPGDTSPNTPANPASPEMGANKGIETMRPDSTP
jgi:hypothetical protein